jgi:hypothetical protein
VKIFLRQAYRRRSGYGALLLFILTYSATMALVIAPDHVKEAIDALRTWPFG